MPKDMSLKRQSKNSVFVNFFKDEKNVLRMYQELHPEATDVTVDDIKINTLESMIVNTLYNDLGFIVKDKFIFLFEAQSWWSDNLTLRIFLYLAECFRRYINSTDQSELDSKRVHLPTPELYVIYSGPGKKPDVLSFSEDFFGGNSDIELKVRVISKVDETLPGQYIGFCKVFDEQRKLHNDGMTVAKETYRLCIENGYLTEFMKAHEQEVIDMMYELFDEETMRKQLDIARSKRDIEKGRAEGKAEGIEKMIAAMRASGLTEEQIEAAKKAML
ncbi:MAG: hypothetical protein J1F11_12190 [Oscillospiraceae bacterium]|nr:hypothetical protein [Oscillospiraceae bacterium]